MPLERDPTEAEERVAECLIFLTNKLAAEHERNRGKGDPPTPSVRDLAKRLKMSPSNVSRTLERLDRIGITLPPVPRRLSKAGREWFGLPE